MTGVTVETSLDIAQAAGALARLSAAEMDRIAQGIGALVEDQTKRRIADDKTAPDGTPWADWSAGYRESMARPGRTNPRSLLVGSPSHLLHSIQHFTQGDSVRVGTPLIYGAIHQFGGDPTQGHAPIPARPYLGISASDAAEISDLVIDHLGGLIHE